MANDTLTLGGTDIALNLPRPWLEGVLNDPENKDAAKRLAVPRDVPVALNVSAFRLPMGMFRDEAFDPKAVAIDVKIAGAAMELMRGGQLVSALSNLAISASTTDLAAGVDLKIASKAGTGSACATGSMDLDGRMHGLVSDTGTFTPKAGKLNLRGTVKELPTAIADAVIGLNDMLPAAVGDVMNATFLANNFSRTSGYLSGRLETANGFANLKISPKEKVLLIQSEEALAAQLALYAGVPHPTAVEDPPDPGGRPYDGATDSNRVHQPAQGADGGDLRRLNGDLEITIGNVEYEAGKQALGLLQMLAKTESGVYAGRIDPIKVNIRNGVVTYERFAMTIDKYALVYSGTVDLPNDRMDLRTELPLEALAQSVDELKGYVDNLSIPIVTRGSLEAPRRGSIRTSIWPVRRSRVASRERSTTC